MEHPRRSLNEILNIKIRILKTKIENFTIFVFIFVIFVFNITGCQDMQPMFPRPSCGPTAHSGIALVGFRRPPTSDPSAGAPVLRTKMRTTHKVETLIGCNFFAKYSFSLELGALQSSCIGLHNGTGPSSQLFFSSEIQLIKVGWIS